jgi:hypothetical protein
MSLDGKQHLINKVDAEKYELLHSRSQSLGKSLPDRNLNNISVRSSGSINGRSGSHSKLLNETNMKTVAEASTESHIS